MMEARAESICEPGHPRTVSERIVDHIAAHARAAIDQYSGPYELTQDGIGDALSLTRPHVATTTRLLVRKGVLDARLAHVRRPDGSYGPARRKVYTIADPQSGEERRQLSALCDYAFAAFGPRGCRSLIKFLDERMRDGV